MNHIISRVKNHMLAHLKRLIRGFISKSFLRLIMIDEKDFHKPTNRTFFSFLIHQIAFNDLCNFTGGCSSSTLPPTFSIFHIEVSRG